VSNDAILPDLLADDTFEAIEVLARHNKSDRPPEFADAWSRARAELPCEVHTTLS